MESEQIQLTIFFECISWLYPNGFIKSMKITFNVTISPFFFFWIVNGVRLSEKHVQIGFYCRLFLGFGTRELNSFQSNTVVYCNVWIFYFAYSFPFFRENHNDDCTEDNNNRDYNNECCLYVSMFVFIWGQKCVLYEIKPII